MPHSTGEDFAFPDADDKWTPEHLYSLVGPLDRWPEAEFAASAVQEFGVREKRFDQCPQCHAEPTNIFSLLIRRDALLPSAAMVRRSAFQSVGRFSEIVELSQGRRIQVEDYDFFLRLSVHARCITSPGATALYRTHPKQASVLFDEQTLLAFKYRMRLIERLKQSEMNSDALRIGIDQMRHAWDGNLRDAWQNLNLRKLRAMVSWGRQQPELASSSAHYRVRAALPKALVRIGRGFLQRASCDLFV